jgi:tetratricopeptide (TPR) repeat protein
MQANDNIRTTVLAVLAISALAVSGAWAGYEEGLQHFKAGKYMEAAAEFQALVDQSPEYDYGYYILGYSFLKLNKLGDAEQNFRKAIELNGDKFEYHHGLAQSLMGAKKYREVVRALTPAEGLAASANQKYALYSTRGFAYAQQKKWPDVIEDLEKAKAIKSSANVMTQLGKAYYTLEHNDKAVPAFRAAAKANPNDYATRQLMGEALIKLGRETKNKTHYKEAMDCAAKCKSLKPDSYEPANMEGRAALGAGDYARAAAAFKQVLRIKPDYCWAMINLGKTYIAQKNWAAAEQPLQNAAKCAPRQAVIYESLGLVYQKYGKQHQDAQDYDPAKVKYRKALDYYDQAKSIKSTSFISNAINSINENMGVMEHNKGEMAKAAEDEARIKAEKERQAAEEAKRKAWEEKQKRDN